MVICIAAVTSAMLLIIEYLHLATEYLKATLILVVTLIITILFTQKYYM